MLYPPVPMTIQRVANVGAGISLLSDSRPALQRVLGQWYAALVSNGMPAGGPECRIRRCADQPQPKQA